MSDQEFNQQAVVAEDSAAAIPPKAPVVVVAGPFGSGVEELAALLADQLHLPMYDPNKLDALASDRDKHDRAWEHLREGLSNFFDYWWSHLHDKPGMARSEHLLHLRQIIHQVAEGGGVIVGVCFHHLMPGENLFRIKVNASVSHCAHRLARLRQCDYKEAIAAFYHIEDEHSLFLSCLLEETYTDAIVYDLELDAEQLSPQQMMEACLSAMDRRHFPEKVE